MGPGLGLMFGKGAGPGPGWGSPMKKSTRIDPRPGRPRPHLQHLTVYYMLILNNPRYMLRLCIACIFFHVVKMAITSYIIYIYNNNKNSKIIIFDRLSQETSMSGEKVANSRRAVLR